MLKRFTQMVLLAVLTVTLSTGAFAATTAFITLYEGQNWISAPIVPFAPSVALIFGSTATGNLRQFDPITQVDEVYGDQPDGFSSILLGDGYIINHSGPNIVVSYEGVDDGVPDVNGVMTDMWISLPGSGVDNLNAGGMHWVGHPFYHPTPFTSILVTDGLITVSIENAVARGWIDGIWESRDNEAQTNFTVGLHSLGVNDTILRPTYMYKVSTHKDSIALIIPADHTVVAEPSSILVLVSGLAALGGIARFRKA